MAISPTPGELMRDPAWQFVGTIIALFALLLAVAIPVWQRRRKGLSYEVRFTSLLTVSDEIQSNIQVFYEGRPLKNLTLIETKVFNSGDIPIVVDDFKRPLTMTFADPAIVLSASVVATHPQNLGAEVSYDGHTVWLQPSLLNPNDTIKVKIIATEFDGKYGVGARVVGVQAVRENKQNKLVRWVLIVPGLAFGALAFCLSRVPSTPQYVIYSLLVFCGALVTWGLPLGSRPRAPTDL